MSSYDLLMLTDGLPPEDSWFKSAVQRDADEIEKSEAQEKVDAAKQRTLSSLYRKVPQHLRPKNLQEVV